MNEGSAGIDRAARVGNVVIACADLLRTLTQDEREAVLAALPVMFRTEEG